MAGKSNKNISEKSQRKAKLMLTAQETIEKKNVHNVMEQERRYLITREITVLRHMHPWLKNRRGKVSRLEVVRNTAELILRLAKVQEALKARSRLMRNAESSLHEDSYAHKMDIKEEPSEVKADNVNNKIENTELYGAQEMYPVERIKTEQMDNSEKYMQIMNKTDYNINTLSEDEYEIM